MPASQTPAPPPPRDGLVAASIAALVVATVLIGSLAPGAPKRHGPSSPAEDLTCAEWSDGCRVCQRRAEGPACSLPGIACVEAEPRCLRHAGD